MQWIVWGYSLLYTNVSSLAEISAKIHEVPRYGPRQFTAKTIALWVLLYRREGFHGLKPKGRSDRGRSRTIIQHQQ
ncbi:hypothetical protein [Aneurinibacillus thermoaerophilus]|uniref:Transposase n=1 Tax=Aneurinibacillus thermoaerophilus TaxID=143495 RepID=A0ABX8YES2_ANETH|nr:hypothetical protein [Aneurinibacillus thermoaerophilus]MED0735652.1 hypothetical protein [Aneurinibacillus thermoaerophilus]QYY44021.1 hypothetical protein K3F53_07515 [Aneurinibacillus thermoaerophilus]